MPLTYVYQYDENGFVGSEVCGDYSGEFLERPNIIVSPDKLDIVGKIVTIVDGKWNGEAKEKELTAQEVVDLKAQLLAQLSELDDISLNNM